MIFRPEVRTGGDLRPRPGEWTELPREMVLSPEEASPVWGVPYFLTGVNTFHDYIFCALRLHLKASCTCRQEGVPEK